MYVRRKSVSRYTSVCMYACCKSVESTLLILCTLRYMYFILLEHTNFVPVVEFRRKIQRHDMSTYGGHLVFHVETHEVAGPLIDTTSSIETFSTL